MGSAGLRNKFGAEPVRTHPGTSRDLRVAVRLESGSRLLNGIIAGSRLPRAELAGGGCYVRLPGLIGGEPVLQRGQSSGL